MKLFEIVDEFIPHCMNKFTFVSVLMISSSSNLKDIVIVFLMRQYNRGNKE